MLTKFNRLLNDTNNPNSYKNMPQDTSNRDRLIDAALVRSEFESKALQSGNATVRFDPKVNAYTTRQYNQTGRPKNSKNSKDASDDNIPLKTDKSDDESIQNNHISPPISRLDDDYMDTIVEETISQSPNSVQKLLNRLTPKKKTRSSARNK
jgi:hypothetical protein